MLQSLDQKNIPEEALASSSGASSVSLEEISPKPKSSNCIHKFRSCILRFLGVIVISCVISVVIILLFYMSGGAKNDYPKETKIKCIKLSTHPSHIHPCGGYSVKIDLSNGLNHCITNERKPYKEFGFGLAFGGFDAGETLNWTLNDKLGECENLIIKENPISFKIKTSYTDDFCPRYLYIKMENGTVFKSEKMNHWQIEDKSESEKERIVTSCKLCSEYINC